MNKGVEETKKHYQRMMFKEALRTGFFEFQVKVVLLTLLIQTAGRLQLSKKNIKLAFVVHQTCMTVPSPFLGWMF